MLRAGSKVGSGFQPLPSCLRSSWMGLHHADLGCLHLQVEEAQRKAAAAAAEQQGPPKPAPMRRRQGLILVDD